MSLQFYLRYLPFKGAEWFGEDGVLIALPDPLKEISYRPPIVEEVMPMLRTEYKKVCTYFLTGASQNIASN